MSSSTTAPASSLQRPFFVQRLPPGFNIGEIMKSPKSQPTCVKAEQQPQQQDQQNNSGSSNNNNKSIEFHVLHTGNFCRICTMPGRLYFLAQNALHHTSPDWKLHVAVAPEDIAVAWNLCVAPVFFEHPLVSCVGMKAVLAAELQQDGSYTTSLDHWPVQQRGRELTVYLFSDCEEFAEDYPSSNNDDDQEDQLEALWTGDSPQIADKWRSMLLARQQQQNNNSRELERQLISFVDAVQQRLDFYGVRTRGIAVGDLPLTRCVSLRNEAYTTGAAMQAQWAETVALEKQFEGMKQRLEKSVWDHNKADQGDLQMQVISSQIMLESRNGVNGLAAPPEMPLVGKSADPHTLLYPLNTWGWNAACHAPPQFLTKLVDHFNPFRRLVLPPVTSSSSAVVGTDAAAASAAACAGHEEGEAYAHNLGFAEGRGMCSC